MSNHCIRQGKDYRYAVKQIQESVRSSADTFVNALVDLALEARFLSVVRHPNIIKMRAMNNGSIYEPTFFVVLDRLYDILSKRLTAWKKKLGNKMSKLMDRGGKKKLAFWLERLTFAYDLACALKYLHDLGILYRDLKVRTSCFFVAVRFWCGTRFLPCSRLACWLACSESNTLFFSRTILDSMCAVTSRFSTLVWPKSCTRTRKWMMACTS